MPRANGLNRTPAGQANDCPDCRTGVDAGLCAVLSHGVDGVSAESLNRAQFMRVGTKCFLFIPAQIQRSADGCSMVRCVCQEYRFVFEDAYRISLAETVTRTLGQFKKEGWMDRSRTA